MSQHNVIPEEARSMGHARLGGTAKCSADVVKSWTPSGKDVIIIESRRVARNELDIHGHSRTPYVSYSPRLGMPTDLKAGILKIC